MSTVKTATSIGGVALGLLAITAGTCCVIAYKTWLIEAHQAKIAQIEEYRNGGYVPTTRTSSTEFARG